MIKEAIDRILGLSTPNAVRLGELTYYDKPLTLLAPPLPREFDVDTLAGLSDLLDGGLDDMAAGGIFAHIYDPTNVWLVSKKVDDYGRRRLYAHADYDTPTFRFGDYLPVDNFIVGLASQFVQTTTDDLQYVKDLSSNLSEAALDTLQDNGLAQTVVIKRGVQLTDTTPVKGRVSLTPFRTFSDAKQPTSDFVFRIKRLNAGIGLALFEADGGAWKLDAINNIATVLADKLKAVSVIS